MSSTRLDGAVAVADAVLYEGYLLYPYRASSAKNAVRWQFGVLGPPGTASQLGEPSSMHADLLLRGGTAAAVTVHLRFLQLQHRQVARATSDRDFVDVDELRTGGQRWLSWDEAVPHELTFGPFDLSIDRTATVDVNGGTEVENLRDADGQVVGRLERRRHALSADLHLAPQQLAGNLHRVGLTVANTDRDRDGGVSASARSLLGAHLLVEADGATFVSLLEPDDDAAAAAAGCRQDRCWPVLASPGDDLVLVSPIILYDHPEIAPESAGELYDATEIDEILSLRVLTMTDEEKAEARATDPRAAAIIDRCDAMSPELFSQLHGRLRDPHAGPPMMGPFPTFSELGSSSTPSETPDTQGKPWWDPGTDAAVDPDSDSTVIDGVVVSRGSRVRVEPRRRADAQDIFFAGRDATVAAVYADVDGGTHIAVVLTDDPAADVREWYGRYLYFAPEELVPLGADDRPRAGKEE